MNKSCLYEERTIPFTQSHCSLALQPASTTPSITLFGCRGSQEKSQLLQIDLKKRTPTQNYIIHKRYGPGVVYYPKTEKLFQARSEAILTQDLVKNQLKRIDFGIESRSAADTGNSYLLGATTNFLLILDNQKLVSINFQSMVLSIMQIYESERIVLDFVTLDEKKLAILVREEKNEAGFIRIIDFVEKKVLAYLKIELKGKNQNQIQPQIFYNPKTKVGVVFRGVETKAGKVTIGFSTFCCETLKGESKAFGLPFQEGENLKFVTYSVKNNSIYLGSSLGTIFQIGLEKKSFVRKLGVYKGFEILGTHAEWDGLLLVFKPEKKSLKLGFIMSKSEMNG